MRRKVWILGMAFTTLLSGCSALRNGASDQSTAGNVTEQAASEMNTAEPVSSEETTAALTDVSGNDGDDEESTEYEPRLGEETDVIYYQGQRYYGMAFVGFDDCIGDLTEYECLGKLQGYEDSVFVAEEMYTNLPGAVIGGEVYYGTVEGFGDCFILPAEDSVILIAYATTKMPEWLQERQEQAASSSGQDVE